MSNNTTCAYCTNKATKYCTNCVVSFCDEHYQIYHRGRRTRTHHWAALNPDPKEPQKICTDHMMSFDYLCVECNKLLCQKCAEDEIHLSHTIKTIDDISKQFGGKVKQEQEEIKTHKDQQKEFLDKINTVLKHNERNKEIVLRGIEQSWEILFKQLIEKKKELIEKFVLKEDEELEKIKKQRDEAKTDFDKVNELIVVDEKILELTEKNDHEKIAELFLNRTELKKGLMDIENQVEPELQYPSIIDLPNLDEFFEQMQLTSPISPDLCVLRSADYLCSQEETIIRIGLRNEENRPAQFPSDLLHYEIKIVNQKGETKQVQNKINNIEGSLAEVGWNMKFEETGEYDIRVIINGIEIKNSPSHVIVEPPFDHDTFANVETKAILLNNQNRTCKRRQIRGINDYIEVRGNKVLTEGVATFKIKIDYTQMSQIMVGVTQTSIKDISYHGDALMLFCLNGFIFRQGNKQGSLKEKLKTGDILKISIDADKKQITFCTESNQLAIAFEAESYLLAVDLMTPGDQVTIL
ncbi:hypothetical protein M0812_16595 [Anaeramoeba flamelloides]|uniref:B box-type domain-containing protein n=1 Tax=Anaeramoeba flamelloides TaxID=1746091 RepID=A0AAV7ZB68_9EUKA|nr:hypothetical protein M0812_16595 [Anaeramoeba flamelloides]